MTMADIDAVRVWCLERAVEPRVTGRHIDLLAAANPGTPFARLRYLNTRRWQLHWRDADGAFHLYRNLPAAEDVSELLRFLAADGEPLFWPHPAL